MNSAGDLGVPKVPKPELTMPVDINFATDQRLEKKKPHVEMMEPHQFKATSLRREIFEKTIGVPPKQHIDTTEPKSPAITKKRKHIQEQASPKVKKGKPISEFSELPGDRISKEKRRRFEQKLQQEVEEEQKLKEFHAQPLPPLTPSKLPAVNKPAPTKVKEFHLKTEERGEVYQTRLREMIETENVKASPFKANPLPPDNVFVPKKSTKPLTQHVDVHLATETRAEQRKIFDEHIAEQAKREEEMKEQEKENQKVIDTKLIKIDN
jgi:targeting protein for Xklp2